MLDKEDLRTIQTIVSESEERTAVKINEAKEDIMKSTMVMMEQYFGPKFNLLAENQQILMEKMVPLARVEKVEGDVELIKIIIRQMREELDQLKGA